ncbi:N-acetylmuramic acid 6-phosphate etherase [Lutispora saccharofermentans]|uniref:N-acetylmuramic acid 6-phosphate etherase n=1 Tax=Lutispora saccharofermentans TaxID=3024236 RepID=A0ABT1NHE2_9FIRM|nr:N-acetylmuramic acid 6-phosphate etherase [Lutispora saccharofermentans]MCQ1530632.1 N-acetylmuramic acid 6-phosphate etherase [Lutispora saccharofermentans]
MVEDRLNMITESINENSIDIDKISIEGALHLMNEEDKKVAFAVEKALPQIAKAIELTVSAINRGGRLIYIGSGTSGRLGVLDASECPPTFNTDPEMVKGIIAGGDTALRKALEGVEDNEEEAVSYLKQERLSNSDVLIGISASGSTPYVLGALKYGRIIGASTVGIACNPESPMADLSDVMIEVIVGPEIISGSTRLKAGTAQKMVLNMISTITMVQLGKTYKNLMVDLQASNVKLRNRALSILKKVTSVKDEGEALRLLEDTGWSVKEAIVMEKTKLPAKKAKQYLKNSEGRVSKAIEMAENQISSGGVV